MRRRFDDGCSFGTAGGGSRLGGTLVLADASFLKADEAGWERTEGAAFMTPVVLLRREVAVVVAVDRMTGVVEARRPRLTIGPSEMVELLREIVLGLGVGEGGGMGALFLRDTEALGMGVDAVPKGSIVGFWLTESSNICSKKDGRFCSICGRPHELHSTLSLICLSEESLRHII
jgi:hypothetical protein